MNGTDFFQNSEKLDFKEYVLKTHTNHSKTRLSSLKTILVHYVDDISRCMESAVPQKKIQLGRLKTSFTVSIVILFFYIKDRTKFYKKTKN